MGLLPLRRNGRVVRAVGCAVLVGANGCIGANALPGSAASPVLAAPPRGAESACAGRAKQPANATWTVATSSGERHFVVHVPPSYDPSKPTPLVLNFHGYRMSPDLEEWLTSMTTKADAAGFVLVYPEGTGSPLSFDAGGCCGDAAEKKVDDVGFTRAMLDALEANLCVDPARVFATGMSNGGFMSHRLACELSDRIAAVAAVSGVNAAPTCTPPRAVPVLDFHGTADPTVPFEGSKEHGWPSVRETIAGWSARDGCTGESEVLAKDDVRCVSHAPCRDGADVELCAIQDGGHTWPGGKEMILRLVGQGKTTQAIVANDRIWDFFTRHPMPAAATR